MADIVSATKNFLSTLVGASEETKQQEQKPRFVLGQPVAGIKHHLVEQQQQDRGWLKNCGAWERLHETTIWTPH